MNITNNVHPIKCVSFTLKMYSFNNHRARPTPAQAGTCPPPPWLGAGLAAGLPASATLRGPLVTMEDQRLQLTPPPACPPPLHAG
jgi:hypothetical protein